jgi:hypothetical protein
LEEIAGVDVIVDGLLEVETVGADLGLGLFEDDAPAFRLPAAGLGDLGAEQTYGEERHSFS